MSKPKWETSLFRLLIQHLRVPELIYPFEMGSSDALVERNKLTQQLLAACRPEQRSAQDSLTQMLNKTFEEKGCFTQANNLAFFLDRVFDVWLRKNSFPDELEQIFNSWRFLFFLFSVPVYAQNINQDAFKQHEQQLDTFISVMDSVGQYANSWSPVPKRSRPILLDQLTNIETSIDGQTETAAFQVQNIKEQWQCFIEKQKDKVARITERLIQSESKKNRTQYCAWLAYHYLNVIFKNRRVPQVLQHFLAEYWVNVVAHKIELSLPANLSSREAIVVGSYDEAVDQCCKNIVRVFCHKGESGFQLADQIIDDLQKMSKDVIVPNANMFSDNPGAGASFFSKDSLWQELSECLVSLLQDQITGQLQNFKALQLPEHLLKTYGNVDHFKAEQLVFKDLNICLADWFEIEDQGETVKISLIADFAQSQQLLFANYLGMKAAQLSYQEFNERIKQGSLKKLSRVQDFSVVFEQAIKGLSKIAENQKQARLQAAEKAKAEAEKLLEDRRKSEELSEQRAQEIAQRTKQLLAKRADKERLEKENAVAQLIKAFSLGAWISIKEAEALEPQRYKLVVKLAAMGKYIFVDRLGIKKREFMEIDLVQAILSKEIEILSDGAEFEDSLERVVSRIRMSK